MDNLTPIHLVFLKRLQKQGPMPLWSFKAHGLSLRDVKNLEKRGIIAVHSKSSGMKYYKVVDEVFRDK